MIREKPHIVLVGFMGAGKSAVGRHLASSTGYDWVDIDTEIEREEGLPISELFSRKGEPYFRDAERKMIERVSNREKRSIISTGGGALMDRRSREILGKRGVLVRLKASPEMIEKRIASGRSRPLLTGSGRLERIRKLLKERESGYEAADLTVETDHLSAEEVSDDILMKLGQRMPPGPESIPLRLGAGGNSSIEVGHGTLDFIGDWLNENFPRQTAIITNPTVWKLHGKELLKAIRRRGRRPIVIQIPDGERYKTLKWSETVVRELLQNRFERSSPVIAFGGGVVGDLAGFVSGIYMRGTPFVQIPTTLIAQVDASIGGKTGVNDRLGKNLIGLFHQPRIVWIDTGLLRTLSARDYRSGLAEVVKYGVIADPRLFEFLERNGEKLMNRDAATLLKVVKWSCRIKAEIVSQDERESGLRKILNYGHTMGHAVESVTKYRKYRHGEAVGIGMQFAASLARRIKSCTADLVERQEALLRSLEIPVRLPAVAVRDLIRSMALDKKVKEGTIYFILPVKIGEVAIRPVGKKIIREEAEKMAGR